MPASRLSFAVASAVVAVVLCASTVGASFHFMQVEQAAGGFCADPAAQAVQLRMRFAGQNLVAGARLVAHDAAGGNPVTLITFPANVAGSAAGSRVLVATPAFLDRAGVAAADFILAAPIPAAYFDAGRLTFESGGGIVYWSLAWGGSGYTGTTAGDTTNDADGEFGPPFAGPLPTAGDRALRFGGAANAQSTSNSTDYALSASPATWTDNAGTATAATNCLFGDGFESGDTAAWTAAVP